ncbi:hypothetical protein NOJ28_21585 [Neorhizobium galegae]|uniref:hypothetical protein n=1 Tax=Neorhizobium galegae TaxID=399 RepID=UPI0006227E2A|nr:hypothetical protein [Neorhizobium galegae]CDZ29956.1 Hypothetical protein NGAL_HAMBI490_48240 [Neorhizobium galegae bv. officinalis]KAB1108686.1 hypothetical protein F4V89_29010 [Neorhizobium galegae]MCQ1768135.1 hypothetical protein [Neorhizobium galegae]MCQ1847107.1 hypothetical protein [Neorhizobium galegae]CDZ34189.1 Hypothetical protein NGAL_HAMBI1146_07380 [Neorhizobium galegae bv. officinalis]
MKRSTESLAAAALLFVVPPIAACAQDGATKTQIERRDPDFCGAGGAGCDPAEVQQWKAVGNRLADLSSADLSQYAYACAKHPEWKKECETDAIAILKRLGIEGY